MNKTGIEWTELTWNPLRGCSRVSRGCEHCYAERTAARFCDAPIASKHAPFAGLSVNGHWTGRVELIESKLDEPLKRRKPSVIFVNSMSDTFHEKVPDEWIDRMFAVMALCPQHRFLVLTKRAQRMREQVVRLSRSIDPLEKAARSMGYTFWHAGFSLLPWPIPPIGLGVSVEDRKHLDRIDDLRNTPATMRFLSLEPLLEDLGTLDLTGISWVIVGVESGPNRRRIGLDPTRNLRDQCVSAEVPFFLKQADLDGRVVKMPMLDGQVWDQRPEGWA